MAKRERAAVVVVGGHIGVEGAGGVGNRGATEKATCCDIARWGLDATGGIPRRPAVRGGVPARDRAGFGRASQGCRRGDNSTRVSGIGAGQRAKGHAQERGDVHCESHDGVCEFGTAKMWPS